MNKLLILLLVLLPTTGFGATGADMLSISKQFESRGWNDDAITYARHAHLVDYSNETHMQRVRMLIVKFNQELSGLTDEVAAAFYPQSKVSTESERILMRDSLLKVSESYRVLLGWTNFLAALDTDRWSSGPECVEESPMNDEACGREVRGDFAIRHLTDAQRQGLGNFKTIVLEELDLIKASAPGMPIGPGPARVFQFLYDSRAIDKLIQIPYVTYDDSDDSDVRKKNITDIGRALIIQIYKDRNGDMRTVDNEDIYLDSSDCYGEEPEDQATCQLSYMRNLVWDKNFSSEQLVTNLVLDRKGVVPLLDALVTSFSNANPESVSREQLLEFLRRAYLAICIAYDLNPSSPAVNSEFIDLFIAQGLHGVEHLINRRNIIGLHVARGIQELIPFLRTYQ